MTRKDSPLRREMTPWLTRDQALFRDKLGYTAASLYVFASIAVLFTHPKMFPKWWAYTMIPIGLLRIWLFVAYDWLLYFAELCYLTNLGLFVYILFLPENVYLACILNTWLSPALWGVSMWNNSLVYQGLEKYTTWHIHFMAPLAMYTLLEYSSPVEYPGIHTKLDIGTYYIYGLGGYLLCLVFNYIVIFRINRQRVLNQEVECMYSLSMNTLTSFRKFLSKFDGEIKYVLYYAITAANLLPWLLLSYVKYLYPIVLALHLAKQLMISLWNGSKYYMEYMPNKYISYLNEFEDLKN